MFAFGLRVWIDWRYFVKFERFEKVLGCRQAKIDSWSCNDFVPCIEAMWGMEWPQPHYPLVLTVLQPLTFSTPASRTTLVTRIRQPLFGSLNMVKEGKIKMSYVSSFLMFWTSILEVLVRWLRAPFVLKSLCFPVSQGHKRLKTHKKIIIN